MKIIAIGDLHGDSGALLMIAERFGLCDASCDWIARGVHLVQIGDVCDRGTDSRTIYDLLVRWQLQAPACGSTVSFILGNHEAMNAFGFHSYTNPEDFAGYASYPGSPGSDEYTGAFSPRGWLYGWLASQRAVLKAGPFVFGHGDLPVQAAGLAWDELDRITMETFRDSPKNLPPDRLPPLLFSETESVLWCRSGGYDPVSGYREALSGFLARSGAAVYVCGHTPSRDGRFTRLYDGRYLCIDTAIAFRHRNRGTVSALVYEDGESRAWYGDSGEGREEPLGLPAGPPPL